MGQVQENFETEKVSAKKTVGQKFLSAKKCGTSAFKNGKQILECKKAWDSTFSAKIFGI
jgi:hypothetical protein